MKQNIDLIFDYDLDGSGSYIVLKNAFGDLIQNYKTQGRSKHSINLKKLAMMDGKSDTLISSDICWDESDVRFMSNNWKRVIYIDHHPESKDHIGKFHNVKIIFDESVCSTMLCFNTFQDRFVVTTDLKRFVAIVNDYDTWNQDGKFFNTGFYLNLIFFKYGFWDYVPKFIDGFFKFSDEDTKFIEAHAEKAKDAIEKLIHESFNDDKIVIAFLEDSNFLNESSLALQQWGYKAVFLIYESHTGKNRVSMRTNDTDNYNIIDFARRFEKIAENNGVGLISVGGHDAAGGIEFIDNLEPMTIYKLLKELILEI